MASFSPAAFEGRHLQTCAISASRRQGCLPAVHAGARSRGRSNGMGGSSSSSAPGARQRPLRLLSIASAAPLNPGDPAAFYLRGCTDMEALADATLVVEGERLLVHSQVLSQQSGVLRGLFADFLSGGVGEVCAGSKRKADLQEGLVIEAPFQDSSLFDTSLFLRFCYCPDDRTPANLAAVRESLPGLLRLAHKLNAPQIQQAVCEFMMSTDHLRAASLPQLVDWVAAADSCRLHELRQRCIVQVASRLVAQPGGLQPPAFANAALVAERCDRSVLAHLLVLLATASAGGSAAPETTAGASRQPAATEALHRQATHGGQSCRSRLDTIAESALEGAAPAASGSLEWTLERYTQHFSAVGDKVCSPWLAAAGREWRFKVCPGGNVEESAGHLTVYLECAQPGTRAKFSITLVDEAEQAPQHIKMESLGPRTFAESCQWGKEACQWGWPKFVTHRELRARPGYLAGDCLVLRARVEVVP